MAIDGVEYADELKRNNPTSGKALGNIVDLIKRARPINYDAFRASSHIRFLATLPDGQLMFESGLQLDTDGSGLGGDATQQNRTSYRYIDNSSVNANHVPFYVLPLPKSWPHQFNIKMGDIAAVIYRGKLAFAAFADYGPHDKLGEGSIELHRRLGFERVHNQKIQDVGIDRSVITIVFPGSGLPSDPEHEKALLDHIDSEGKTLFQKLGGRLV